MANRKIFSIVRKITQSRASTACHYLKKRNCLMAVFVFISLLSIYLPILFLPTNNDELLLIFLSKNRKTGSLRLINETLNMTVNIETNTMQTLKLVAFLVILLYTLGVNTNLIM